ncbi:uncharacterized protein HGUI_00602 [Hanseniaspora guilliermondii]|uniref:Transcriptional regulatory protein SDS3 n=1 Tax=Hanseniaspora guilliermondii TaxID=56406 RepID=A0A1L0AVC9_9ASCO|nr:uncharacterized protein HGUI_00602 [Hanseniaspora guilliermondii]
MESNKINIDNENTKQSISNTAMKQQKKKKQSMENRIHKLHTKFTSDRHQHYQNKLNTLQARLTAMHEVQNEDPEFNRMMRDLQEERDLELVKLRLFEEYRIARVNKEFQQDIEEVKMEYEKVVTNLKKKLFENIETQIKSLQEEKILLDVANEKNYNMDKQTIQDMKYTYNEEILGYNKTRSGKGAYSVTGSNEDLKTAFLTAAAVVNSGENYDSVVKNNDNVLSNLSDPYMSDAHNAILSDDLLSGLISASGGLGNSDIKRSLRKRMTSIKPLNNTPEIQETDELQKTNKKKKNGSDKKTSNNQGPQAENDELAISAEWLYEIQNFESLRNLLMDKSLFDLSNKYYFSLSDNNQGSGDGSNGSNGRRYERKQPLKTAPKLEGLNNDQVTDDLNFIREKIGKKKLPY